MKNVINIAKDYSRTPGPRRKEEGKFSGEDFLESILGEALNEAIEKDFRLRVVLDGTAGYPPSFLDESFGGFVRKFEVSPDSVISHLELVSEEEPFLVEEVIDCVRQIKTP